MNSILLARHDRCLVRGGKIKGIGPAIPTDLVRDVVLQSHRLKELIAIAFYIVRLTVADGQPAAVRVFWVESGSEMINE